MDVKLNDNDIKEISKQVHKLIKEDMLKLVAADGAYAHLVEQAKKTAEQYMSFNMPAFELKDQVVNIVKKQLLKEAAIERSRC